MRYLAARRNTASVFVFLFVPLSLAVGQNERGVIISSRVDSSERAKWAVIIGVSDYTDGGLSRLPNAVRDARAVHETLTEGPGGFPAKNVVLLTDDAEDPLLRPTRSNILAVLGKWVELAGPSDCVLVYFAGHGVELDSKLYLMPLDARSADVADTGVSYTLFESRLGLSRAGQSIVVLDACHSGAGRGAGGMSKAMLDDIQAHSTGRITLASCDVNQLSHEYDGAAHGAFTWFLLQGLKGGADENGDGLVSALEMSRYCFSSTRRWAAAKGLAQTPRLLADISGDVALVQIGITVTVQPGAETASSAEAPPSPVDDSQVLYLTVEAEPDGKSGKLLLTNARPMPGRFEDNGDGTVSDTYLHVLWQKESSVITAYEQAISLYKGLQLGGHTGWRLPTLSEAQTLLCMHGSDLGLDPRYFGDNRKESRYWVCDAKGRRFARSINYKTQHVMEYDGDNCFAVRAVCDLK